MKKKIRLAFAVTATLGAGTIGMSTAQAAPVAISSQLGAVADSLNMIQKTQFIFEGKEYCWYDDGWHGPGWYWCGYALRQGFGWGGGFGWHHWRGGHRGGSRQPVHGPGSSHNPIINRPPELYGKPRPSRTPVINCEWGKHRPHPAGCGGF